MPFPFKSMPVWIWIPPFGQPESPTAKLVVFAATDSLPVVFWMKNVLLSTFIFWVLGVVVAGPLPVIATLSTCSPFTETAKFPDASGVVVVSAPKTLSAPVSSVMFPLRKSFCEAVTVDGYSASILVFRSDTTAVYCVWKFAGITVLSLIVDVPRASCMLRCVSGLMFVVPAPDAKE